MRTTRRKSDLPHRLGRYLKLPLDPDRRVLASQFYRAVSHFPVLSSIHRSCTSPCAEMGAELPSAVEADIPVNARDRSHQRPLQNV